MLKICNNINNNAICNINFPFNPLDKKEFFQIFIFSHKVIYKYALNTVKLQFLRKEIIVNGIMANIVVAIVLIIQWFFLKCFIFSP